MLVDHMLTRAISEGRLGVEPYERTLVQPNTLDVRLDQHFLQPAPGVTHIDTRGVPKGHMLPVTTDALTLPPGGFALGSTLEYFRFPRDLVGKVEGKSSLGRLGLLVHVTAGVIDSGFQGHVTLELKNVAPWSLTLCAGMPVAQLCVESCATVDQPYAGRYQGQRGPQESRYAFQQPAAIWVRDDG